MNNRHILPRHWNPKREADAVMSRLVTEGDPGVGGKIRIRFGRLK